MPGLGRLCNALGCSCVSAAEDGRTRGGSKGVRSRLGCEDHCGEATLRSRSTGRRATVSSLGRLYNGLGCSCVSVAEDGRAPGALGVIGVAWVAGTIMVRRPEGRAPWEVRIRCGFGETRSFAWRQAQE